MRREIKMKGGVVTFRHGCCYWGKEARKIRNTEIEIREINGGA